MAACGCSPSWMPYLWRSPSGFTGGSSGICCAERRRAHDPFGTRFFKRQHLPEHSDPGGPHDGGPAHQRPLQRGGPHLSGPAARSPGPDGAGTGDAHHLHRHGLCQPVRHRRRTPVLHPAGQGGHGGGGAGDGQRLHAAADLRRRRDGGVSGPPAAHALPLRRQRRHLPLCRGLYDHLYAGDGVRDDRPGDESLHHRPGLRRAPA